MLRLSPIAGFQDDQLSPSPHPIRCRRQACQPSGECGSLRIKVELNKGKRGPWTGVKSPQHGREPTSRKFKISSQIKKSLFSVARSLHSRFFDFRLAKAQKIIPCLKFAWHITIHLSCKKLFGLTRWVLQFAISVAGLDLKCQEGHTL